MEEKDGKEKKLKLSSSYIQLTQLSNSHQHFINSIQADEVINMANILGLSYDGPILELKE